MKKSAILISALFFVGLAPAYAEDGARLFKRKGCYTCHGQNGAQPIGPNYPVLAGQKADYIFNQIKSFSGGHRSVLPKSTTAEKRRSNQRVLLNPNQMVPFANSINKEGDAVIKSIANYLASQTPKAHNDVDSSLAEQGKTLFAEKGCSACHGETGTPPAEGIPGVPKIAGLGPVYIEHQLEAFRRGTRSGTDSIAMMAPNAGMLSAQESTAIANYLGSVQ